MWFRVVIGASVLWLFLALAIIFAEYLFRDPLAEHYFWAMPPGGALDLLATPEELIRKLEPRIPQIAFILFGPVTAFWVLAWLGAWAKRGAR